MQNVSYTILILVFIYIYLNLFVCKLQDFYAKFLTPHHSTPPPPPNHSTTLVTISIYMWLKKYSKFSEYFYWTMIQEWFPDVCKQMCLFIFQNKLTRSSARRVFVLGKYSLNSWNDVYELFTFNFDLDLILTLYLIAGMMYMSFSPSTLTLTLYWPFTMVTNGKFFQ